MTVKDAQFRQAEALRLRALGWTYDQIAEELNYASGSGAYKAVQTAYIASLKEPAEIIKRQAVDRLDIMLKKALEIMASVHVYVSQGHVVRQRVLDEMGDPVTIGINEDGSPIYQMEAIIDHAPVLDAIRTALKIEERRAKLLGLDAPKQMEILSLDYIEAHIRRLAEEIGADPSPWLGVTEEAETGEPL
jgi:hypothetical protein